MTKRNAQYQPGPIFSDVVHGGFRVLGLSGRQFAAMHDVPFQNIRPCCTGHWNGPKAKVLRAKMIETIGDDLFEAMYRARLEKEGILA